MKQGHEIGDAGNPREAVLAFVQLFVALLLVWVALNGLQGIAVGLLAAGAGAASGAYFAAGQSYPLRPWRWLVFAGFFLLESFKGGADVAWRAMHPALHIQPEFQDYPIRLAPGLPTTFLTSIVSLLPGTLSARLSGTESMLIVHALTPSAIESVKRLEDMLLWLFAQPGAET